MVEAKEYLTHRVHVAVVVRMVALRQRRRLIGALSAVVILLLAGGNVVGQELSIEEISCKASDGFTADARIGGTVTRAGSDVAVSGAAVEVRVVSAEEDTVLARGQTRTDSLGRFVLCSLPVPAHFEIMAGTEEAASEVLSFAWGGASDLEIRLELQPGAGGADLGETLAELREQVSGDGTRIVGRVQDRETGRPVSAATVRLSEGMGSVASDGQGRFALPNVLPGRYELTVRHLGYSEISEIVQIPAQRTVEVDVQLSANPVELEPIVVTTIRNHRLETQGFYERKEWGEKLGLGHFFTQEDIERRNPVNLSQMVADLPGARLNCSENRSMRSDACYIGFTRIPDCKQANVYLDGAPVIETMGGGKVKGSLAFDDLAVPSEVAAVEVYKGAASVPAEFSGSRAQCGVIAIWTR